MVYTLKELVNIKYGKNQKDVENPNGKYPIYGTGGLMSYADKCLYDKPSVLIGRKGSISKVKFSDKPFWTVDTLFYTEVNEDIVIPKYLYYKMLTMDMSEYNEGTTIPSLRTETLYRIELDIPDKETQKRVIEILDPLEQKIELNNEINNNLHELLKDQYYKIFVEDKKDSWINDKLGNYLSVDRGLSYKGKFLSETGVPMINLGNIMPNGVFRIEKNKYYSGDYKDKVTINVGDIVIANTDMTQNREVIGTPVIVPPIYEDKIIFSHHIYGLRNLKLPKMYIFYTLLTDEWNAIAGGSATGTTVLALPKETIENYVIAIPDSESLQLFDNIAENIQSKRNQIMLENIKLEQLRDTLLPKLMNGEIDLENMGI